MIRRFHLGALAALLIALSAMHSTANPPHVPGFTRRVAFPVSDTTRDSLKYPIADRRADAVSEPVHNAIDLKDPSNITRLIEYDPLTRRYYIVEKIGGQYYRKPSYLNFEEFYRLQSKQQEDKYWQQKSATLSFLNRKTSGPALYKGPKLFDRIFGGTKVDIRPQGYLDMTFGYQGQNVKNPVLIEQARKNGGFDFDLGINMNVLGRIGDKLKLTTNYNSQSVFDFENQVKLEYTGGEDEIIKKIEAGNVSFPLRSSLISGVQSLFGIKTQLQFGRLTVTSILSNQKSQKQNLIIQNGSQTQEFSITADQYEDNRHFLLAQYFHDNYNYAMSTLPIIRSQVYINRVEIWVTNKTGATTNTRDVVGLMDLGERKPYNPNINSLSVSPLPFNNANDEYQRLANDLGARDPGTVVSRLLAAGLQPVQDFEKTFARKLDSTEYRINRQLGFISLNQQLQPDEVLAIAYQYTYNGRVYQVGEFSQDVPPDQNQANQKVLFLKLLKATSARPRLPIWNLMMKNIYATGAFGITRQDFKLNVFYQEPGGGEKRYLPEGPAAGIPLITLLNLDRLNNQNDPQPDGVFDYVEGYTINSQNGKVIFPVLEPFGRYLDSVAFQNNPSLASKYVFGVLYDSIKVVAQQFPQLNRYILRGSFKSSNSSEINLGGYNIPQGSVTVTAGGQRLQENVDYVIDYSLGRLKIINNGLLNAGIPINVQFENQFLYGQQIRNYLGTRLDYYVNDRLSLGSSIIRMSERPFYQKVLIGDDPIKNTIVGIDANYRSELPGLTRLLDRLPNYSTNTPSNIVATGEVAKLFPGHSRLIGKQGTVYIDDFDGTRNGYDLKFPYNAWALASTPRDATDQYGNVLFPEANLIDSLQYGINRAKIAWYTIEPTLVNRTYATPEHLRNDTAQLSDPRVRLIYQKEVFPNRTTEFGQSILTTFDLAYYPTEKGPYNFDTRPGKLSADGRLLDPKNRWGGIMRAIDNSDFETANYESIEFWVQDPFVRNPSSKGGQLYINLGNVSEDILRDSKKFFENGLPNPNLDPQKLDSSKWGRIPKFQQQLTQAFDNDPAVRAYQDVGYDGLKDNDELNYRQQYLNELKNNFGVNSAVYQRALRDPDNDDYHYYRGSDFDQSKTPILERYKQYNNPEGNSPVSDAKAQFSSAATNIPESEDLNRDNTLNETEEYFQYRINLKPDMTVGKNYLVDRQERRIKYENGTTGTETWYQFRIPLQEFEKKIGNIPDFKSIRFMRMFLTGFEDSVVLRFAKLELVRNQWRRYQYSLKEPPGVYIPVNNASTPFAVSAVNIEENSVRYPVPYVLPPGIQRQPYTSANNATLLQNEQSISLKVCDLKDGDSRGVFKTLNIDLRQFRKMQMFIHAEAVPGNSVKDGDIHAIIRLGNDFVSNYYEYRIPLKITRAGEVNPSAIWPERNNMELLLTRLANLKEDRNIKGFPLNQPYVQKDESGNFLTVVGNPNLGDVRSALIGILNPPKDSTNTADDGLSKCAEVWFNEFRVSEFDEKGGYAALARVDLQLADLGTLTLSGAMHTQGFGSLEQRLNERFRDNFLQYDAAANLQLGKLLPRRLGLSIPVYAGYSQATSNPQYDPYDLDVLLKDKLKLAPNKAVRDSIRNDAQDFTSIKSINFTNVRKLATGRHKPHLWDIENFDFSYSFTQIQHHNPVIENDIVTRHRGGMGYNFAGQTKFREPFRKLFRNPTHWLDLLRDFNFNLVPSIISFRADLNRQFGATRPRNIGGGPYKIPETYDKYFTFDRYYVLKWDLTRSINIDFAAVNNARVDEPYGRLNKFGRDSLWQNLLRLGRTTSYRQTTNFTYNLPTNKFPLLDWTNVQLSYQTNYSWTAASRLALYLGNAIENSNVKNIHADFNFTGLYNKSRFLRAVSMEGRRTTSSNRTAMQQERGIERKSASLGAGSEISPVVKALLQPLLFVKRVAINYSENVSTYLPGYLDSTQFLGQNLSSLAPGLKFAFGYQPDRKWLDDFAKRGLITRDTTFNIQFRQQIEQRLDAQAQLQPIRDLRIDINLTKSFSKSHTELFKDTSSTAAFSHLAPYDVGGFSVSYIALKSLFEKVNTSSGSSPTFSRFENYRAIVSQRLGKLNPYSGGMANPNDPNYAKGYGRYAQDVLIPAFLAAYAGKDPKKVPLVGQNNNSIRTNPFKDIIPLPNWRLTYTGLNKVSFFRKFLSNLTITHAYVGNLSMNNYNAALLFQDPLRLNYPGFIDTISHNFIPYFLVPNLTVAEQLDPLLGIDLTFTNSLNARLQYRKTRQLSLSLIDYQLSESRSSEIIVGAGFRYRGLLLPFAVGKNGKRLDNDINFRIDLSFRDDKTVNNRLDADLVIPTSGQKVIRISPSIDYVVNNRVNLRFFYDRTQSIPVISTSFPSTNTRAGLIMRFVLQ